MTANTTGQLSDADKLRKLIDENNSLQRELTSVTAELKEVTQQRDALHPGEGRVVVDLPKPYSLTAFYWKAEGRHISAHVDAQDRPYVKVDGQIWLTSEAHEVGAALLAAFHATRGAHAGVNHG